MDERKKTDRELADDIRLHANALSRAVNDAAKVGLRVSLDYRDVAFLGRRYAGKVIDVYIERVEEL